MTFAVGACMAGVPLLALYYGGQLRLRRITDHDERDFSDSRVLFCIILVAMSSHAALPVKTSVLLSIDVLGLLAYTPLAFAVDSPEGPSQAAENLVLRARTLAATAEARHEAESLRHRVFIGKLASLDDNSMSDRTGSPEVHGQPTGEGSRDGHGSAAVPRPTSGSTAAASRSAAPKGPRHSKALSRVNKARDVLLEEMRQEQRQQQGPARQTGAEPESIERYAPEPLAPLLDVPSNCRPIVEPGPREKWLIEERELDVKGQNVPGASAFGVAVSAASHAAPVAVKIHLRTRASDDARILASASQIVNELRILCPVRCSNIVLFCGTILNIESGEFVLVPAQRLDQHVQDLNLPDGILAACHIAERFAMILGVSCSLNYLHSQQPRIAHGDLTSANVMAENRAIPRLTPLDVDLSSFVTPHERLSPRLAADVFFFRRPDHFIASGALPFPNDGHRACQRLAKAKRQIPLSWAPDLPLADRCQPAVKACIWISPQARPRMGTVHGELEALSDDPSTPRACRLWSGLQSRPSQCQNPCRSRCGRRTRWRQTRRELKRPRRGRCAAVRRQTRRKLERPGQPAARRRALPGHQKVPSRGCSGSPCHRAHPRSERAPGRRRARPHCLRTKSWQTWKLAPRIAWALLLTARSGRPTSIG